MWGWRRAEDTAHSVRVVWPEDRWWESIDLNMGIPEEDRFQQMFGFRFHFPLLPLHPAPLVIPFQGLFLYQMCPNQNKKDCL